MHNYHIPEFADSAEAKGRNWGNKFEQETKWLRKDKLSSWCSYKEEWEKEERARERLVAALSSKSRSPSPPRLHLRSPSPPLVPPYPLPTTQHLSFTSFVLDPAAQRSFRSEMITDLEQATCTLIEGETQLRRAMGRLWQVLSDKADCRNRWGSSAHVAVTKQEDTDEIEHFTSDQGGSLDNGQAVMSQEPPLQLVHRLFLNIPTLSNTQVDEMTFEHAQRWERQDAIEKGLAVLRELQEDSREYVERLEEIREDLGSVRNQRQSVWTVVRERSLKEMEGEFT